MKAEIVTYTGKLFDIFNPEPELVCIEDIAHSLANQCRYTGHTKGLYSVAQHSVLMATSAELGGDPLVRLLHDSAETYFGDISSPLKRKIWVPDGKTFQPICNVESKLLKVIGEVLGVDLRLGPDIKVGDGRLFVTEVRDLMGGFEVWKHWRYWDDYKKYKPLKHKIVLWSPKMAEVMFLRTYRALTDKKES